MSNKKIRLVIVSLERKMFDAEVDFVNVSSGEGELGIYPLHSPMLATLKPGIVSFMQDKQMKVLYTSGGFVEVQPQVVSILADVAIRAEDLDKERILRAKNRCEETLGSQDKSKDFKAVQAKLQREIAKLRAYELINANSFHNKNN